jgi:hypothetical protein
MSNTNKVLDMIANEALAIAHEKAAFLKTVDRQYDDSFGKQSGSHKSGSTLRVRLPNSYVRRTNARIMDVQDQNERTSTMTLATQDGVDMRFNSAELSLEVNDPKQVEAFSKRYIEPAMSVLVSGIESDALAYCTKQTYNLVGTAGTVVGASGDISALFNARARLNRMLAPKEDRAYQIDSVTMGTIVNGKTGLFHPDGQVAKAFTEGYYGRAAGADFYENERTFVHTTGADHTGTTDAAAAVTDGGSTLSADTASPVTLTVGSVFTIAGVYACHPETKQSLGYLQQFTNTAGTGSGGDMTISPATYLTGPYQNVCKSDSTQLATTDFNSQTLTIFGSTTTAYQQNLVYHKDAFQFVTADLPLMDNEYKCVRKQLDGLSMRVWMGSDIRNDELLVRLDILYGFAALRPEWACRISN